MTYSTVVCFNTCMLIPSKSRKISEDKSVQCNCNWLHTGPFESKVYCSESTRQVKSHPSGLVHFDWIVFMKELDRVCIFQSLRYRLMILIETHPSSSSLNRFAIRCPSKKTCYIISNSTDNSTTWTSGNSYNYHQWRRILWQHSHQWQYRGHSRRRHREQTHQCGYPQSRIYKARDEAKDKTKLDALPTMDCAIFNWVQFSKYNCAFSVNGTYKNRSGNVCLLFLLLQI